MRPAAYLALLLTAACASRRSVAPGPIPAPSLLPLSFAADSVAVHHVASGVTHYRFVRRSVPWVINVLDVDRASCWGLASVKAGGVAVGRARLSALVAFPVTRNRYPVAAVNGDFFSFTPPGIPTGASINAGTMIAGPGTRPVLATDSLGRPWLGTLRVDGVVLAGPDTFSLAHWNRRPTIGLGYFDSSFGTTVDTAQGAYRVLLPSVAGGRAGRIDSAGTSVTIPAHGGVLWLAAGAPDTLRRRFLRAMSRGEDVEVRVRLLPFHPAEAVGGFPVLLRDSSEVEGLDQVGGTGFGPVRHPRTVVGLASGGRSVLLVTVDGRQDGYSAGMTLREAAGLLLALGATEALNLDGGGSTTMALRTPSPTPGPAVVRLVNHPSDKEGERPVANALAVVPTCP